MWREGERNSNMDWNQLYKKYAIRKWSPVHTPSKNIDGKDLIQDALVNFLSNYTTMHATYMD